MVSIVMESPWKAIKVRSLWADHDHHREQDVSILSHTASHMTSEHAKAKGKLYSVMKSQWIHNDLNLRYISLNLTDDNLELFNYWLAWCGETTNNYMNQCWQSYRSPHGVTGPQQIKLEINITGPNFWWFSIGSSNGLVPSGKKSLHEPMLTKLYVSTWHHWATMS